MSPWLWAGIAVVAACALAALGVYRARLARKDDQAEANQSGLAALARPRAQRGAQTRSVRYHPALVFTFFACAIVLGMFVRNPAFLAATSVFSGLYYAVLAGRRSLRMLAGMVALFIAVAVLNPLFNTRGDVVLFTYFDRPYTLEALAYGVQTAALLVGMLLWFSCYNIVMTSDKFTYLFGRMAPSVTLVFTMVLRLIPAYHRKIDEFAAARSGIGRSPSVGTLSERIEGASAILSALTSWALEGGMSTADSMRSRGFGQARRTAYARYRFTARDGALLACMALLAAISIAAIAARVCKRGLRLPYCRAGVRLPLGGSWGGH